jgi:two-component system sensor histidine kinase VicK
MDHEKTLWISREKDAFLALDGAGKILDASAPVEQVTGYKPVELVGRLLKEFIPDPGGEKKVLTAIRESIAQEAVAVEEFRFRNKDGKDFPAELIMAPFRAVAGKEAGCQCLLRNVTPLEEASKCLQEAYAMREQFTATVSHELRTPLFVVKEIVTMLLEDKVGAGTGEQKRFLGIAKSNVGRLEKLIDETLDLKALDQGRKVLHLSENSVGEIFDEIVKIKKPDAQEKGLRLTAEAGTGVPRVNLDREQILDCLGVLLDFAIRKIESGNIVLSSFLESNMVRISIRVPSEENPCDDLSRLFLRFEPLNGEEKAKLGRTGVEFARAKEIVEKHHGKIWAYYFSGQGTFFQILLPVWEKRARQE